LEGRRVVKDGFLHLMKESRAYYVTARQIIEDNPNLNEDEVYASCGRAMLMDFVLRQHSDAIAGFFGVDTGFMTFERLIHPSNLEAGGILRRLAVGESSIYSEMQRTLSTPVTQPL